jgi:ankyrin repeat domain-containing protein 50
MDSLEDQITMYDVWEALTTLPTELDATYHDAMSRIESQRRGEKQLAEKVLSWVSYALRPLTLEELQHALAIKIGESKLDGRKIPDEEEITPVCAGLLIVEHESRTVRFTHYTAEDYFKRVRETRFPTAQTIIVGTCLTYLSFDVFATGACTSDEELESRLHANVFLKYAAQGWMHHMHGELSREIKELVLRLFEKEFNLLCFLQVIHIPDFYRFEGYSQQFPKIGNGLHIAAFLGLGTIARLLLEQGANAVVENEHGKTALHIAAARGHEEVVQLLVARHDVAADSKDNKDKTPLWHAVRRGHEAVVGLLAARADVNIDSMDKKGRTPLWCAFEYGGEAVMEQLLICGADVNAKDLDGNTALSQAAELENGPMMSLLLRYGVDIEAKNENGLTVVEAAVYYGQLKVVQILLENKAMLKPDSQGQTALHLAVYNYNENGIRMVHEMGPFLDQERKGPRLNITENLVPTRSGPGAFRGDEIWGQMVPLLLKHGVDMEGKDVHGKTALNSAVCNAHELLVRILLKNGADVNARDNFGLTPLHQAAHGGNEAIARILLENGADITAKDDQAIISGIALTPIQIAGCLEHWPVVKLLIEKEAEFEADNGLQRTALHAAANIGWNKVVQLLLADNADIEARDVFEMTPLLVAAMKGNEAVALTLLESGADVAAKSDGGWTALHWGASSGHEAVVKLLLARGANIAARDHNGQIARQLEKNLSPSILRLLEV